jgi:hypothetical protein
LLEQVPRSRGNLKKLHQFLGRKDLDLWSLDEAKARGQVLQSNISKIAASVKEFHGSEKSSGGDQTADLKDKSISYYQISQQSKMPLSREASL